MQEDPEPQHNPNEDVEERTRPQRAGEAATTRFGMEDGDNTDVPATGGPQGDDEGTEGT
jgi:hypothetical protein